MKCPICSGICIDENSYAFSLNLGNSKTIETNVHRCRGCGVHFRDVDYSSEEIQSHFDVACYTSQKHEKLYEEWRQQYFLYLMTEILRELRSPHRKLLDIGCSYGHMMKIFKENGEFDVCGIEIHKDLRARLADKGYNVFKSIKEISGITFSVISLIDTLFYFQQPLDLLIDVYKLLDDDGVLLIRVRNTAWIANLCCRLGITVPSVCMRDAKYSFTYRSLEYLLDQAGFVISKVICAERGKSMPLGLAWLFYRFTELISKIGIARITPGLLITSRKK